MKWQKINSYQPIVGFSILLIAGCPSLQEEDQPSYLSWMTDLLNQHLQSPPHTYPYSSLLQADFKSTILNLHISYNNNYFKETCMKHLDFGNNYIFCWTLPRAGLSCSHWVVLHTLETPDDRTKACLSAIWHHGLKEELTFLALDTLLNISSQEHYHLIQTFSPIWLQQQVPIAESGNCCTLEYHSEDQPAE